jgi:hypothetical protein
MFVTCTFLFLGYKDTANIHKRRQKTENFAFFIKKSPFFFADYKKSRTFAAAIQQER